MITQPIKRALPPAALAATITMLLGTVLAFTAGVQVANAAPLPNRFLFASHFGWEVNKATHASVCAAKEECQPGKESNEAGGFSNPFGVAVDNDPTSPDYEDVYVTDRGNHRVQELTPNGQFVSMFGWDVNRTKVEEPTASQAERNICTAASHNVCQTGAAGAAPGQFSADDGVAVDPTNGDVYVADTRFGEVGEEFALAQRVEEFTAAGQFLLEIGKEVNQTSKANLCLAAEACGSAALQTPAVAEADMEAGAFDFEIGYGNVLTVGGPHDLLYVGGHSRVQEFEASGKPAGREISLTALSPSEATSVAVDATGDVFVADNEDPGVHEYDESGALQPQAIDPGATVESLAVDPHGRLGIVEVGGGVRHGVLYSAAGTKLSEFAPPSGEMSFPRGLAFAVSDRLYVAEPDGDEVEAYMSVVFPETQTCTSSAVTGTSASLCGEIDPDGVQTDGFFQYGPGASFNTATPTAFEGSGEAFAPVSTQLTGLVPNQEYQYRIAAEAQANGEQLQGHGESVAFHTLVVPPQIPGQPSASFVASQSAVLNAVVDPEHTSTTYRYEYGACPSLVGCTNIHSTPDETSGGYGATGFTSELTGLTPATTYSYRLVASNEFEESGKTLGGKAAGEEGTFTTAAAPVPSVQTGAYSALTPTSAVISGMVDPAGVPASYAFELGVYEGAGTQYGVVASGSPTAGTAPVEETMALSGLQPGTTYAYRIVVHSGYGEATGATATFTTPGLPSVLSAPASQPLLATPSIAFPTETKGSTTTPKALTKTQKLAKALKLCKKDRSRAKRATCEKAAHRKYGAVRAKKKK